MLPERPPDQAALGCPRRMGRTANVGKCWDDSKGAVLHDAALDHPNLDGDASNPNCHQCALRRNPLEPLRARLLPRSEACRLSALRRRLGEAEQHVRLHRLLRRRRCAHLPEPMSLSAPRHVGLGLCRANCAADRRARLAGIHRANRAAPATTSRMGRIVWRTRTTNSTRAGSV